MKRSLVVTLGVAVLALSAGWALAQNAAAPAAPAAGPGDAVKPRGEPVAERLGLSAEQRDEMRAILKAAHEETQNAPDREAKAKILREAMEKVRTTVLNDEQRKKWDEVRAGAGERARERAADMFDRLGLSPEQKESVKAIMQAAREEAQKVPDREAKAKIIREAIEKVKSTVLTEDQRKKLEAAPEDRGPGAGGESIADRVQEHLARLSERLGLTPAQQEAAREILKAAHGEMQNAADPQAKAKILRDAMEKISTTILTDDQRKKLREGREEGRGRRGPGPGAPVGAAPTP